MAIFSENRTEWFMTELACCANSVCIVPVAVEQQFTSNERVCSILNITEVESICVSRKTIGLILDLKSQDKLKHIKKLIMFDRMDDIHTTLASQCGLELFSFNDLVSEGFRIHAVEKEEPNADTLLILGVTSGTTGEPKIAMLTHINFISGQASHEFFGFCFTEHDVYLSYVPITHVYEQILHISAVMFSFSIGYSSGDTTKLVQDI